jgi:hypothetical protein
MKVKPEEAFDPEHVFSRGLCGTGANWTLATDVCSKCNGRFSAFEAHWMRQAIEATARNFHGLESRSEKTSFDRIQPVEIDHLYLLNDGDPLVYEAGFAFLADPHFRPQVIDTPTGLLPIAGSVEDGNALQKAINSIMWDSVAITIPTWHQHHDDWLIAELEPRRGYGLKLVSFARESKPRGLWLRSYPHDGLINGNLVRSPHSMSARLALDHRKRLYLRAANIEVTAGFLTRVALNKMTDAPPPQSKGPGRQTQAFGFELDLVKIYLAVMKNGFNLFAHMFGAEMARDSTFNSLRKMLLDEPINRTLVMQHCRMYDQDSADFPKSGNPKEHRLQLELNREGVLRFRLRLFDSLGYEALLAQLPYALRSGFQTKRVAVEYAGSGIREVGSWT